jgi:aspartyl-tRNA(Asn)/glutamyl-tRNA(Gln) amidotransferase subunit A
MCATSLGEDTGGSVRGPAANCGLVGLRPSWGRVSRYGVDGASWSLDTIGPISRTVEDCAATIGAIAGYDPRDPYTWDTPVPDYTSALGGGISGLKIGLVKEFTDPDVSPATSATLDAIAAATEVLSELGADVQQVSLPLAPLAGLASRTISAVERAGLHPEWIRERADDFHPNIRVQLMTAELIPGPVYNKAQKMRSMIRAQTLEMLESVDVLLMPTSPAPPQVMDLTAGINTEREAASWLSDASFRGLFSMVSGPALSICSGFTTEDGVELPLAMQIAGKPFDEATLLRVAHIYEQATEWHTRRPPI